MAKEMGGSRNIVFAKKIALRALKAFLKGFLLYIAYFVFWMFIAPIAEFVPSFQQVVENFFIIYVSLVIIGELVSDTVLQHFFNAAKALFVIGYLIISLNGGILNFAYSNVVLTVDLRFFLMAAVLIGLIGLAKCVIQAIEYMNNKAEIGFKA
ncbi:hypothetical protein KEJ45_03835 [Candidatus Bathyarchaeota archaeon]|nr:hypothetical protein [Candidatus Bathyarchaeota archaeon]